MLLACALRVFARRGIGAAHYAEIAALARVSVPTVFVYFPTRAALVDAVLAEVERFYIALAEQAHASRRPAPEVVTAHAMAFARSIDEHPDHATLLLNWSSAVRTEHWPRYQAMETRVVALLARTLARGQRQGSIAIAIHRRTRHACYTAPRTCSRSRSSPGIPRRKSHASSTPSCSCL